MNTRLSLRLLAPALLALPAAAGSPATIDWEVDPAFPSGFVSCIETDALGNTFACSGSNTVSSNVGVHLFQVSKFGPDGGLLWERDLAPAGGFTERAVWLDVDSQGNVVVTGWLAPLQSAIRELVTLKYDPAGNLLWDRRYVASTSFGNTAHRVQVDAADNVYVFGSGSDGGGILKVLKYDPAGNLLWLRGHTPAGSSLFNPRSMKVRANGEVAILSGLHHTDFYTRAYDTAGNLLFDATYTDGVNGGGDLTWGASGELYLCGGGAPGGVLPVGPVVVRVERDGSIAWDRLFNGPNGTSGSFLRIETNSVGDVVAAGSTASGATLPYVDWAVAQYDAAGNLLWDHCRAGFDGNDESITGLRIGSDDSAYVVGSAGKFTTTVCGPTSSSDVDATVARYSPAGAELWLEQIPCSGQYSWLTLDPVEGVVVTTPRNLVRIDQGFEFLSLCNGDGGDQMGCTDCPCGNQAAPGTVGGCVNGGGTSTRLEASGLPSVSVPAGSAQDLRFGLTGAPASAFCVLLSGDAVAPQNVANPCFGLASGAQSTSFDGLRCAVQNTQRHGGRGADAAGTVGVTTNPWGGEGGPPAGIAAAASFAPGQTRYFQVTHRDDPAAVCLRGLNTSQAVRVVFTP